MENKYSYTLVGGFVLLFIAAFCFLIVWFTVGTQKTNYLPYQVITTESVNGLTVNSTVNYNGVSVGSVTDIKLNLNDPRYVTISLKLAEGTPIKKDTKAVLVNQGITGLIAVSLEGGTRDTPNVIPTEDNPVPIIENGPSLGARLDQAFTSIDESIKGLTKQMRLIVTAENAKHINNIIKNADSISQDLAGTSSNIKQMSDSITTTLSSVETTMNEWDITAKEFTNMSQSFTNLSQNIKPLINNLSPAVNSIAPAIDSLSSEANSILYSFNELINELKQNPNRLLLGKPSSRKGPGE